MTKEEKAKAYNNSLEKARKWYDANTNEGYRGIFEDIFPELRESEDERIMKALIKYFTLSDDNADYQCCGVHYKDIVAWLEKQGRLMKALQISNSKIAELVEEKYNLEEKLDKQGEHNPQGKTALEAVKEEKVDNQNCVKPADKVEPKFKVGQSPLDVRTTGYWHVEDIEQKPAEWTEEDERLFQIVIDILDRENHLENITQTDLIACVRKLKSLKDRVQPQWKPSDAQMASITCAVRKMKESACYDSELVSLLNDLKKLKE